VLENSVVQEIAGILAEPDLETKLVAAIRLCARADRIGAARRRSDEGDVPPGRSGAGPDSAREPRPGVEPPAAARPPGRPAGWTVVPPFSISDRPRLGSPRGRYLLLHSVAHIELSAVELALMAVADFPGEPAGYYRDMLRVAAEEVAHTRLLRHRLRAFGGDLGTDPVHLGLWETARRESTLIERLAVVPRILEARGLDVSGSLRERLLRTGDAESARILERIHDEEIGHVAAGTRWYRYVCDRAGIDPEAHFISVVRRFRAGWRGARIDREGRLAAGFTERELGILEGEREDPE
jgi:uncharacterized ferritin-like protein (DUF455 family)